MDILQYLITLLKTRKQIGIEGLGTLYKKKTPGRYDAETHSFLPPSYTLAFTTDLLENNHLSAYIQAQRNLSEDSAKYFISQFVEELQKDLKQGNYTLANLGSFSTVDGQLTFTPSEHINTGFDFFALPAVTAQISAPITAEDETIEEVVEESLAQKTEEPSIEQVQVPEFEQELNKLDITKETEPEPITAEEEIPTPAATAENLEQESIEAETAKEEAENEVFEEITEVPESFVKPTTAPEGNTADTWNFDNENVIAAEDVNQATAHVESAEKIDGVKLTAPTHKWDFDTIDNSTNEENTLIGEFDHSEEAYEEEETPKMPLYQKLSLGLLVLMVVFGILYFVKPDIFESFRRSTSSSNEKMAVPIQRSNLKTQQDSLSFADSIMQSAEKAGLDVQPAKDTLKVSTSMSEVKPIITYDVIIASFATETKANEYVNRMKKKGFDAKISAMHGSRKNISIATYNNVDSAEKHLAKFRKQFKNSEIYIQKIKNN